MTTELDGQPRRPPAAPPRLADAVAPPPPALSRLGLLTVLLGTFLPMLDFFIVNVALPTIGTDLHAGRGRARARRRRLRHRVRAAARRSAAGSATPSAGGGCSASVWPGFTVTSLLCGIAPTIGVLVAARVAQGATAALMVPQVLATIQVTTQGRAALAGARPVRGGRRPRRRGRAAARRRAGLAPTSPAPAGGSIFLVNVPVGAARHRAGPPARAGHPRRRAPAAVDVPGTVLFGLALLALLVPLTEGRALGWPLWTLACCWSRAVPLAAAFDLVERRLERAGRTPLLPPSLLRLRGLRLGLSMAVPFFIGLRRLHVRDRAGPAGRARSRPDGGRSRDRADGGGVLRRVAGQRAAGRPVRAARC